MVSEHGSASMWETFSGLLRDWDVAGRPGIGRYGLTVAASGEHLLWLDRPDGAHRWGLDRDEAVQG